MEFNKNSLLCFFQFVTVGGIVLMSRRLVQALTVPIFRAQAAVSEHTLQRDNVGQVMVYRWVAAYLFRLGPYSSDKDLDFILLPYVNLVLPT